MGSKDSSSSWETPTQQSGPRGRTDRLRNIKMRKASAFLSKPGNVRGRIGWVSKWMEVSVPAIVQEDQHEVRERILRAGCRRCQGRCGQCRNPACRNASKEPGCEFVFHASIQSAFSQKDKPGFGRLFRRAEKSGLRRRRRSRLRSAGRCLCGRTKQLSHPQRVIRHGQRSG